MHINFKSLAFFIPHFSAMACLFSRCQICSFGHQWYYLVLMYFILHTAKGQWFAAGYENKIWLPETWPWGRRALSCALVYTRKIRKTTLIWQSAGDWYQCAQARMHSLRVLWNQNFSDSNMSKGKMFCCSVWHSSFSGHQWCSVSQEPQNSSQISPKLSPTWKKLRRVFCMLSYKLNAG